MFKRSRSVIFRSVVVSSLSVAVYPVDGSAEQTAASFETVQTTVAGQGSARFDWMANKKRSKRPVERIVLTGTPLGNGSWICSPAGFGKQARCYRR